MAYVITPGCCSDASCVAVCPVDCIHPSPGEPDFGTTATLFVDPRTCIDCGACADACPVDAIGPADLLSSGPDEVFIERNRAFFDARPAVERPAEPSFPTTLPASVPQLNVAIVGTGPAAFYTADLLLRIAGAEVTMFDRLPVSGGLLRYGVAPDHPATKKLADRFIGFRHNPRLHLMLGAEVGTDISPAELAAHFDAVIYAVGASASKNLGIPGEDLIGSLPATEVVAWYNGHPDATDLPVKLEHERAVLIGNGNVALDVARILLVGPQALATTDIADRALTALASSNVREVVVAARRGPADAAYTGGELHNLCQLAGVDVVVADTPALSAARGGDDPQAALIADLPVVPLGSRPAPDRRRVVFAFGVSPQRVHGAEQVEAIEFTVTGSQDSLTLDTGLAVRAIGYAGRPVAGLPFDPESGRIPHDHGRIRDSGPGQYVVGWIKRGASGGIGANRQDAADTVRALLDDAVAGRLTGGRGSARHWRAQLRRRFPDLVDKRGLRAIEEAELSLGRAGGRTRIKLSTREELLRAANR